jgi:hypothetical protein
MGNSANSTKLGNALATTRKGRAKLVHRIAGGIALMSPEQGPKISQYYFERSLTVAPSEVLVTPRRHEHGAPLA